MSQESAQQYYTNDCSPIMWEDGAGATDSTHPCQGNTWLDKFFADLGYHNLTFLTSRSLDSVNAVSFVCDDTVDGCIRADGFKIIKAIVTVLM